MVKTAILDDESLTMYSTHCIKFCCQSTF